MKDFRFWELALNPALVASLTAMASSQAFKFVRSVLREGRFDLKHISDYGGFPSSHSAFAVAGAFAIGITEGYTSAAFAIGVIVAAIFIYDILRLRPTIAQSKKELDRLIEKGGLERIDRAPQFEAHSLTEVLAGIVWGLACAALVCFLWP
jgi:hypothetical protein